MHLFSQFWRPKVRNPVHWADTEVSVRPSCLWRLWGDSVPSLLQPRVSANVLWLVAASLPPSTLRLEISLFPISHHSSSLWDSDLRLPPSSRYTQKSQNNHICKDTFFFLFFFFLSFLFFLPHKVVFSVCRD